MTENLIEGCSHTAPAPVFLHTPHPTPHYDLTTELPTISEQSGTFAHVINTFSSETLARPWLHLISKLCRTA